MISTLISLIVAVILLGVLWWAVQQLLPLIPVAEPFRTILRVLVVLVGVVIVVYVLLWLLAAAGVHVNTFRLGALALLSPHG